MDKTNVMRVLDSKKVQYTSVLRLFYMRRQKSMSAYM